MTLSNATAGVPQVCWSCQQSADGGHFCAHCGKIQAAPGSVDYFTLLGLPPKLQIDPGALELRFHQLSWKLHPDNFVRASSRERELALGRSSQVNDAYRTLREPVSRVEYLLRHRGLRKEGATKQQAPPELLEEVFELNESLDELRRARAQGAAAGNGNLRDLRHTLDAAQHNFESKLAQVDTELQQSFAAWDAAIDAGDYSAQQKLMHTMNEILNRRSYVRNLVANVQQELTEA